MATVAEKLLTAEEYARLPDDGQPTELVRGKIITLLFPPPRHGETCAQAAYLLSRYLENYPIGRLVGNNSGIVTKRDPDTVRGPDIAFYSFTSVPGPLRDYEYLPVSPELVLEVLSASDRWIEVQAKAAEYLEAGVKVVCVLDQQTQTALVYTDDATPRTFTADEELTFPEVLGEFHVTVRRFFE